MILRSLSFRTQILILTVLLVLCTLVPLLLHTVSHIRNAMYRDIERKAVGMCEMVASTIGPGLEFQDSSYISDYVAGVLVDDEIVGICICDENEANVYRYTNLNLPWSVLNSNFESDTLAVYHEDEHCIASMPVLSMGRRVGNIWLVVTEASMTERISAIVTSILYFSGLLLALVLTLGVLISRKIVQPIRLFESAATRIRDGDTASAIDISTVNRDFVSLGQSFNEMRAALASAFEDLNASREHLEEEVQERTGELRDQLAERRRAEKALVENQALLRETIESTADGILVEGEGRTITLTNTRFAQMWGFVSDEFENYDCLKLCQSMLGLLSDSEGFMRRIEELPNTSENSFDTIEFKDGRAFELYTSPLIHGGRAWGRIWCLRDITERKRSDERQKELQEHLNKAEKMESLGLLAGGVAHDLNNMLGPMVAYPDLILEQLEEQSGLRKHVRTIGTAARAAASVIQDLLTLARRGRYEMCPTNLNEVVDEYLESPSFLRLTREHPEILVTLELDKTIANLYGSGPHLSKVVMNLITNAFDAMPGGGELTVKTHQMCIKEFDARHVDVVPGDYVLLRVRDTGMGIDEKDLDKIFEPYYSKKKMGSSGSGLGLAVVYGIVKDHQGWYNIESTVGEGTEFILNFPVSTEEVKQEDSASVILTGKESVLIVDDDEGQREVASDLLLSLGYRVATARNGHEAVKYLTKHTVDIVVLDMIMEDGFDGLDTYVEILKLHPEQKAIIVSGFSATERVSRMQALGAGQYIRKPYNRQTLGLAIREEVGATKIPIVK